MILPSLLFIVVAFLSVITKDFLVQHVGSHFHSFVQSDYIKPVEFEDTNFADGTWDHENIIVKQSAIDNLINVVKVSHS